MIRFLIEIVSPFLTALVLCAAFVERPHGARCPDGWWLSEGVRADGSFACSRIAPERASTGPRGGYVDASDDEPGELRGRVYCRGDERAQTFDGRTVVCR